MLVTAQEVQGLWVSPDVFRLTHRITGRSIELVIPDSKKEEPKVLDELIQWQTEKSMAELRAGLPPPLNRDQQHDLGATLMEIRASKRHRRESLHGRWW